MIWDFIRDFIVEHITGGVNSAGEFFNTYIGYNPANGDTIIGEDLYFNVGTYNDMPATITLGDWLATTLTTICMCLIVAFAIWLIIWVFKAVAHAFLLRR